MMASPMPRHGRRRPNATLLAAVVAVVIQSPVPASAQCSACGGGDATGAADFRPSALRLLGPPGLDGAGLTVELLPQQTLRPANLVIPIVNIGPDNRGEVGPLRTAPSESSAANPMPLDGNAAGDMRVDGNRFYIAGSGVTRPLDAVEAESWGGGGTGFLLIDSPADRTGAPVGVVVPVGD